VPVLLPMRLLRTVSGPLTASGEGRRSGAVPSSLLRATMEFCTVTGANKLKMPPPVELPAWLNTSVLLISVTAPLSEEMAPPSELLPPVELPDRVLLLTVTGPVPE
jgi:hypothetical protein